MKRDKVESTSIVSAGFENGTLEVEFLGGRIYRYQNVTEDTWRNFQSAKSKGSFLRKSIMPHHQGKRA